MTTSDFIRAAWAGALNGEVPEKLRKEALSQIHHCSISSRLRLTQYEVSHKLHFSKTKLICLLVIGAEGSFAHLFWFCPALYSFLSATFTSFSDAHCRYIQPYSRAIFACSLQTSELQQYLQTPFLAAHNFMWLVLWSGPGGLLVTKGLVLNPGCARMLSLCLFFSNLIWKIFSCLVFSCFSSFHIIFVIDCNVCYTHLFIVK